MPSKPDPKKDEVTKSIFNFMTQPTLLETTNSMIQHEDKKTELKLSMTMLVAS